MANDKDFVVNGPVVVGKDTKVTVGSISAGAVDLSTGNYFTDSPSGDYTYTFTNPGDVQSFQIEATGGSDAVAETFSTTLYTGTGAVQDIDNGLDLAGDGGLVWIKGRTFSDPLAHMLWDTERGSLKAIFSNTTDAEYSFSNTLTSFNASGFSIGLGGAVSSSGQDFVSWTFKKQAKFFDVVTYTGDGDFTGRTISHSLGSVPGMILIKKTSGAADWIVYHRSEGATKYLELNNTSASNTYNMFNDTDPTATEFSVSSYSKVNNNGDTYVAYLFAHDTASDGLIQCGSYTGTGSYSNPPVVNLGWSPSWIMIKRADGIGSWQIYDTVRGATQDSAAYLRPDQSQAEQVYSGGYVGFYPTSTGFSLSIDGNEGNASGDTYIYMAIRSASAPAITWPTNIEWTGGSTPSTPAEGETDVYTFTTDDGGTTYTGIQSIDNAS